MSCKNCDKELSSNQRKYCSNQCQQDYKYKRYIERWKLGEITGTKGVNGYARPSDYIRRYLLAESSNCCEICGISEWRDKPITLQIDHIDGDWTNNSFGNLRVLCPNCHSQTETFGAKNKTVTKRKHNIGRSL